METKVNREVHFFVKISDFSVTVLNFLIFINPFGHQATGAVNKAACTKGLTLWLSTALFVTMIPAGITTL